jgi:hypothetical protein
MIRYWVIFLPLIMLGCAHNVGSDALNSPRFYFSTADGRFFKYSGGIHKMALEDMATLGTDEAPQWVSVSNKRVINYTQPTEVLVYRYALDNTIVAGVFSKKNDYFYYVTAEGDMYKRRLIDLKDIKLSIPAFFPLPHQMIYASDSRIIYHDGNSIFEMDVDNETITQRTRELYPIASIALHESGTIYFSLSTDGGIYACESWGVHKVYDVMSESGSVIAVNGDVLVFSKRALNGIDFFWLDVQKPIEAHHIIRLPHLDPVRMVGF